MARRRASWRARSSSVGSTPAWATAPARSGARDDGWALTGRPRRRADGAPPPPSRRGLPAERTELLLSRPSDFAEEANPVWCVLAPLTRRVLPGQEHRQAQDGGGRPRRGDGIGVAQNDLPDPVFPA